MKVKTSSVFGLCLLTLLFLEAFLLVDGNGSGGGNGNGNGGRKNGGRKRKNKERQRQQQLLQQQLQMQEESGQLSSGDDSSPVVSGFLDSSPIIFADHHQSHPGSGHGYSAHLDSHQQFHYGEDSRAKSPSSFSEFSGGGADEDLLNFHHQAGLAHPPPPSHTCEPIRIDICRNIGYNVTSMPNFVGHELQADGELQLTTFLPLINYGCSSQLKFFLCSVYVPMCTEKVPVTIGPCRPLCESVRARCAPVLEELGFPWPEALNCSKFVPTNSVDQMCMDGPPPDYIETLPAHPQQALPPTIITSSSSSSEGGGVGSGNLAGAKYHHHPQVVPAGPGTSQLNPVLVHQKPISVSGSGSNWNQQQQAYPPVGVPLPGGAPPHTLSHQDTLYPPHHPGSPNMDSNSGHFHFNSNSHQPSSSSSSNSNSNSRNNPIKPKNRCDALFRSEQYVFLESPSFLFAQNGLHTSQCVPKCDSSVLFSEENKQFVDYWTAIWAALAVLSCALTLAAFFASSGGSNGSTSSGKTLKSGQTTTFRYPERAVVYIAVCSMLAAGAYLYRAAVGRQAVSCHFRQETEMTGETGSAQLGAWLLVSEAAYNPHCTASFLLLYYFGMAGAVWFTVLAGTLSAAVAFRLPLSSLSRHRTLYHCLAWCLPAAQTLAALVLRAVDADELTGVCYVGAQSRYHLLLFVLLPSALYLGAGVLMLVGALVFARFVAVREADECPCGGGSGKDRQGGGTPKVGCEGLPFLGGTTSTEGGLLFSNGSALGVDEASSAEVTRFPLVAADQNPALSAVSTEGPNLRPAGSGQSLLLSAPLNHFCTVSSTASYSTASTSSSASSSSSSSNGHQPNPYSSLQNPTAQVASGIRRPAGQQFNSGRNPCASIRVASSSSSKNSRNSSSKQNARKPRHYHLRQKLNSLSSNSKDIFAAAKSTPFSEKKKEVGSVEFDSETAAALIRSAIFALFYLLPAACVAAGYAYEYAYRDSWLYKEGSSSSSSGSSQLLLTDSSSNSHSQHSSGLDKMEGTPPANRPNFEVFNMRLFMSLVIGINTGIWILTAKSPVKGSWWGGSSSSSSSSSSSCFFLRCFFVKKAVPVGGASSVGSNSLSSAFGGAQATMLTGGGGNQLQTTLPVYPMSVSNQNPNPNIALRSQNHQLMINQARTQGPVSFHPHTTYHQLPPNQIQQPLHNHNHQQQQHLQQTPADPSNAFFFLSDLASVGGSSAPTVGTGTGIASQTLYPGSTATNSTLLSSANSSGQQQQQQQPSYFVGCNLNNQNHLNHQQPWPGQSQGPRTAPGNETAV